MLIFNVQVQSGSSHENIAVRGVATASEARNVCTREGLKPTNTTVEQISEYGIRFCHRVIERFDCPHA